MSVNDALWTSTGMASQCRIEFQVGPLCIPPSDSKELIASGQTHADHAAQQSISNGMKIMLRLCLLWH